MTHKKPEVFVVPRNLNEVKKHYATSKFPIFAKLAKEKSTMYPSYKNKWLIIEPVGEDALRCNVDSSWNANITGYHHVDVLVAPKDITYLEPGEIPEEAEGYFKSFHVGCTVTIDTRQFSKQSLIPEKYSKLVGRITSIKDDKAMVTFKSAENHINKIKLRTVFLIRLPSSFAKYAPPMSINVATTTSTTVSKPTHKVGFKFKVGDTVRCTIHNNLKIKNLIGKVVKLKSEESAGTTKLYEVDFDNIYNRSLALCGKDKFEIPEIHEVKQWDLDHFNTCSCQIPQHLVAQNWEEEHYHGGWSCVHQEVVVVDSTTIPNVNEEKEIIFKVKFKNGDYAYLPHTDIDYFYNRTKLITALEEAENIVLATECFSEEEEIVFLYIMDKDSENPKVKYRIRLGIISDTPSLYKKYLKFKPRIKHPWQVKRYLKKNSLGIFFKLIKCEAYLNYCNPPDLAHKI